MNNNSDWGMAAAGVMLALLDTLEQSGVLSPEQTRETVHKGAETIEQLALATKQPAMMRGAEILHGIFGEVQRRHKKG